MKKITLLFTSLTALVLLTTQLSAQNLAVQQPVNIQVEAAKKINFSELAQYELQHPPVFTRHYVSQGEDHDADFRPIPRDIPAGSAAAYHIAESQAKALANSPATLTSFNGVMDNGTLIPPDIRGAVGPTYVLQTTNQQFNIYTKTGTLQSTLSITSFFSATGGSGYFDPHCVYDPTNGRFIVCIDGNVSNGDGGIFVAVSQTNDPTGSWYVYSFDGIGNKTDFLDYPLLGYNSNWLVVTGNDFIGGSSPVYAKIYVMSLASLYSGTLGTVSTFTDQNAFCMDPAQTFDNTQTTEYLVQDYNGNSGGSGYMQVSTITGTATAPVYTAGGTIGVTQPWSETSVAAKQLGNSNALEDGDTRVGNSLYINGSLWFCHTVFLPAASPTYSAVDWWQINPATLTVQQFGRLSASPAFYYYPSISVNTNGDALLGYCQSSSTQYSSASYAFHAAADAANTMETGVTYKAGVAGYYKTYGGGRNRWGDFTGSAVDPSDNSFWNFSEWANTSNNWGTVIAHIPASGGVTACNAPTGMTTTAITANTATFSWTAATGANSYNIQYRIVGTTTWSTGTSTTNSFNATGLTATSNYEWQVATVCSSGSSAFTASTDFSTTAACNTITGQTTSAITNTTATISWTAATGAASYSIQYRQLGTTTWTPGSTTATTFNLSGLTAGTTYEWQVQTVCASGSSAFTASTDFTTTGTVCNVPSGLTSASITSTGATLSWGAVTGATTYTLQWKLTSGSTWTTVTGITTNSYALSGLASCSAYQYQVATVCSSGTSAYSATGTFTTIGCALNYCASKGTTTTYEYINKVVIGTISNTSTGDGGYGNFTNLSTNLAGGSNVTITLTPGFHGTSYKEYFTVYIDYNHNGVFTDAGEIVAEVNGKTTVSKTFTVPTTALNGATRMRIQMQYNSQQTNPCATITYGDVQDYTVNITGNAHGPVDAQPVSETEGIISGMKLYPNPAQSFVTLEYNSNAQNSAAIHIYNLAGQQVLNLEKTASLGLNTESLNTANFSNGMYIVEIEINGETSRQKFMVTK